MIKSDYAGKNDSDENRADDGMQGIYLNDESNLLLANFSEKDNMFSENLNRYLKEKEKKILNSNENGYNFINESRNNSKQHENESKILNKTKDKQALVDKNKQIFSNDNGDDDDDELLLLQSNTGKL
jgi:hypothetical protein